MVRTAGSVLKRWSLPVEPRSPAINRGARYVKPANGGRNAEMKRKLHNWLTKAGDLWYSFHGVTASFDWFFCGDETISQTFWLVTLFLFFLSHIYCNHTGWKQNFLPQGLTNAESLVYNAGENGRWGYCRDTDCCRKTKETSFVGVNRLHRYKVQHNTVTSPFKVKTRTDQSNANAISVPVRRPLANGDIFLIWTVIIAWKTHLKPNTGASLCAALGLARRKASRTALFGCKKRRRFRFNGAAFLCR